MSGEVDLIGKSRSKDIKFVLLRLIIQIRNELIAPVDYQNICLTDCYGCPKKLLEYLEDFLDSWESKLQAGYRPHFGDLSKVIRVSEKSRAALVKNGLL